MKEIGIDTPKLKKWAKRLNPRDLVWLRETVTFALSTPHDLREFVAIALHRSHDGSVNQQTIRAMIEQLAADEIVWFCDEFKRPSQHDKRRGSRSVRYCQIRQGGSDRDSG
jgi:hypothetical protein